MNQIKTFFSLFLLLAAVQFSQAQCSDLFFSEYIEGNSNNKALEVFNPTGATVDLTDYAIYRFNNGAVTASATFLPQGTLGPDSVYVIGNPNGALPILIASDTTNSITFFNGDDALILVNLVTGDTLDAIGEIGVDPGTNWPVGTGATSEFTLIRKMTIQDGETNWAVGATQWDVYPVDMLDSLGFHNYNSCATGPSGPNCSNDIFFSEYIEGSSSNKALEIYNPMDTTVDLTAYVIYRYNNGSVTATDSLFPQDTLASDSVWVVVNPSANAAIQAQSDTTHTITFYNGDDALLLINRSTGDTLDAIGEVGIDPGSGWTVGTGATNNFTLIRQRTVQEGETNWTIGATQWDVFAIDMTDSLGAHTMDPCTVVPQTSVSFFGSARLEPESAGAVTVQIAITNPLANDTVAVDVNLNTGSSTATQGVDFTYTDTTIVFPAGSTTNQTVTVTILQDVLTEANETIVLDLVNATNGASIGAGTYTLTIEDDDFPTYPIGTINTVDTAGIGDSLGVKCWTGGIVYGVNMRPSGLQFTIIDGTGGIGVFSLSPVSGYTVTETDSVAILGTVNQFNGLLQIDPDTIAFFSTGNPLKPATVVTGLGENTESDLVRFNNATLVNPAQWSPGGSGFNVDVTNGTDTIVVRIDADVDLFNQPAPTGTFDVCGLGGQFDSSDPRTSGYQLLPRYQADIKQAQAPVVNLGNDTTICSNSTITLDAGNPGAAYLWSTGDTIQTITVGPGTYSVEVTDNGLTSNDTIVVNGLPAPVAGFTVDGTSAPTYTFTNTSTGTTTYAWDFGDGMGTSTNASPSYTYTTSGNYVVTLIATGLCGSDTLTDSLSVTVGFEELAANAFEVYPNPSNGNIRIQFNGVTGTAEWFVTDLAGKTLFMGATQNAIEDLHLKGLSEGMYFLKVSINGKFGVRRLIIE